LYKIVRIEVAALSPHTNSSIAWSPGAAVLNLRYGWTIEYYFAERVFNIF